MEEAKTVPLNPESQKEIPLTREQRRALERLNKEAGDMIARLVNQWYEFFLDHDPDGPEVKLKKQEVSAKWRMYCKRRRLVAKAFPAVDEAINQLIEEYKTQKHQ